MSGYEKLLETATRLVIKKGRRIVLSRMERDLSDPAKPWRGPISLTNGGTPFTLTVSGVFVPPNTVREFGIPSLGQGMLLEDLIKVSQQIIIIAGTATDLKEFNVVEDREETWGIQAIQVLRPGEISLLSFIGVRR